MHFDWDDNKNELNIKQHALDFEHAKELFNNDLLVVPDLRFQYKELRYIGYGIIEKKLMVVVYTERLPNIIRIISFRKGNNRENKIHKKNKLD